MVRLLHLSCFHLVITNSDGCTSESDSICDLSVGIEQAMNASSVFQIRNLANNVFTIHVENGYAGELSIADVSGKTVVYSRIDSGQTEIPVAHISRGIYLVSLLTKELKFTQKIFVE